MNGSYSYGTNQENSDLDVRGIALDNRKLFLKYITQEKKDKGRDPI